jgi:vacuolar-type H+-ATPase subunit I/STV1
MNNTPTLTKKTTRSNSATSITLADIQQLITKSNGDLMENVQKINSSIKTLSRKIDGIEDKLAELQLKIDQHDTSIHEIKLAMKTMKSNITADLTEELQQRSRRINNLIVSGISENSDGTPIQRREDDEEKFSKVVQELGLNCNKKFEVMRIGKVRQDRPRLLKVTNLDPRSKQDILKNAKKLRKSSSFKFVYINNDLTPIQQKESKLLRNELQARRSRGENVVIYRNQVRLRNDLQIFH